VISSKPRIGGSFFTNQQREVLPQPRLAWWQPRRTKTVIRAGLFWPCTKNLKDAWGYRAEQNAPFNPVSASELQVSSFPGIRRPPCSQPKLVPGGGARHEDADVISWSLRSGPGTLSPHRFDDRVYVGSHGYHELIWDSDATEPFP